MRDYTQNVREIEFAANDDGDQLPYARPHIPKCACGETPLVIAWGVCELPLSDISIAAWRARVRTGCPACGRLKGYRLALTGPQDYICVGNMKKVEAAAEERMKKGE
jgi:hypothetical protein